MRYLLGILVVIPAVLLVVGQVRGRAKVRTCCPADPALDRRMAAAFGDTCEAYDGAGTPPTR